jgi:hypothetical protein
MRIHDGCYGLVLNGHPFFGELFSFIPINSGREAVEAFDFLFANLNSSFAITAVWIG